MSTLVVLGSGSGGNAFALLHDGALLLLDAGFSVRELDRRLRQAGLDVGALAGVVVSHEHGDHATGATKLAKRHDVPLLCSMGTWQGLSGGGDPCDWLPIGSRGAVTVGPFSVSACPTSHDANEPVALGVVLADGCSIGLATDLGRPTQAVRWFLRERHCLVLEANHDPALLRECGYPASVQDRIAGPSGHLSNQDCAVLLEELHHEALHTVVLAHLSQRSNSVDHAHATIAPRLAAAGFAGELIFATQDGPMPPVRLRTPAQQSLF